ncbi:thioredoxin fold domain-containing protein [Catenovulum agarivorans]|uniref:thioredoxin fold domain-containing protein n=1 Tax=Catenovulum agarivorans TaxID=1172192 RepID=UPI0012FA28F0|nr:thioredoxin fold domain-containing protein [Catenovulum agarivorans]
MSSKTLLNKPINWLFIAVLVVNLLLPVRAQQVMPIPDPIAQQAFLLNGWRADRPNLLVFKDPFCPYCIKVIPKLDQLAGYNIYLFWAPILGSASKQRSSEFFQCQRPVSEAILAAVEQRQKPQCDGELQSDLMVQNTQYVDAYQINAVPSFYLQGQKVSLARLLEYQQSTAASVFGVKPDWQRFTKLQQLPAWQAKNLVLLIAEQDAGKTAQLLKQYQPEYVIADLTVLTQNPQLLGCSHNTDSCFSQKISQYQTQKQLFMLMFGDSLNLSRSSVIERNGTHLYL